MNSNDRQQSQTTSSTAPWVVIPTYNEKENINQLIDTLFDLEIPNLAALIVDDSSPDGTAQIVQNLQTKYPNLHLKIRPTKSGLGPAYIDGFQHAINHGATSIVQMDADFSHDPDDVPRLLKHLIDHDLVIGSRYVNGISVINWPLKRLLISMAGNVYASFITRLPFKDTTGGFKAWRAEALKAIDLPTVKADGYGFQIVITYRAWQRDLKIKEIPIVFTERREGQSKMNRAIVWEAIWLVWKLRLSGK